MQKWTEKIDAGVYTVGSLLLTAGLTVILVLSCGVVVNALYDLKDTNARVAGSVESAEKELKARKTGDEQAEVDANQAVYIEQLKTRSRSMLDSNTISFLFQIFTVALVSSGVYILARSQRNLRRAEEATQRVVRIGRAVRPFVANAPVSSTLSTHFVVASSESRYLKKVSDRTERESRVAQTRESLTQLLRAITRARAEGRGMERPQYDVFLDQVDNIRRNVAHVRGAEELMELCKECELALKEGEFIDRYHEQLREICQESD